MQNINQGFRCQEFQAKTLIKITLNCTENQVLRRSVKAIWGSGRYVATTYRPSPAGSGSYHGDNAVLRRMTGDRRMDGLTHLCVC